MKIPNLAENLSAKEQLWKIRECQHNQIQHIMQQLGLPEIIARILVGRNVALSDIPDYLSPTLKNLMPDPNHLLDMEKAAIRLAEAIIKQQKIVIFGDYDVDGATSSALLKRFFAMAGLEVEIYIPDRLKEGYGPNAPALLELQKAGAEIIITVDCGTAANQPLEAASVSGLEVIVVDHHLGGSVMPKAVAIVNPNRLDETSSYKGLAAVGVAFLLAVAINKQLRDTGQLNKPIDLLSLLDLVALGTVCDMVPIDGVNRAFVAQGLKVMAKRSNLGLAVLCDVAGVNEMPSCYVLGFLLGPRINAGGRVGRSSLGAELLTCQDYEQAYDIARQLDGYNTERKAIEAMVLEQAMAEAEKIDSDASIIMVAGHDWHPGVIGIVASRIKERFNKPVAVISLLEKNIGKASCRSVKGVDFGSGILSAKELGLVTEGGGHAMAAGFSVTHEQIPQLEKFLNDKFAQELAGQTDRHHHYFDGYLTTGAINLELAQMIARLGPYGSGNPEPRFMLTGVYILKCNVMGANHVSCILGHEAAYSATTIRATAFRVLTTPLGDAITNSRGKKVNIVGYIRINRWNGNEKVEMTIEDLITS